MPRMTDNADVRDDKEAGLTLILVALCLIVLLVFAALVVDVGGAYSMRRDDQNAADVAALAAVHELGGVPATRETRIANTVKQQAHVTLGKNLTDAQWNSCPPGGNGPGQDPGALQRQIPFANCISYNPVRVRVRVPDQYWKTTFGAVVGQANIRHSAFAVAGLEPEGFGGVLPFAVAGSSAQGGLGCLKSNSNGQASALCGSSSGNFGYLNFSHYGSATLGTARSCGNGDTSPRIEANTAMGVDHPLSVVGTVHVNPVVDAPYACNANIEAPDAVSTETGNMADRITRGLFYRGDSNPNFSDGQPARLQRELAAIFAGDGRRVDGVAGVDNLDDNALWRFIPPNVGPLHNGADFPVSCQRNQFVSNSGSYYTDLTANTALDPDVALFLNGRPQRERIIGLLNRCFQHYRGLPWDGTPVGSFQVSGGGHEPPAGCGADNVCTAPVFSVDSAAEDPNIYDIQLTSRFGYVPEISDFPNGTGDRSILRFRAVFIQRVVIDHGGSRYLWDPGFGPSYGTFTDGSAEARTINSYQRVAESLVFVFPNGMLPGGLADESAPFQIGVNVFPELIR